MMKKRIVILLVIVIGVAAAIYGVSVATNNLAILAVSPLVLGFIACPLMCAALGGGLWVKNKISRNRSKRMKINMKSYRRLTVSQRLKKNKGKDTEQSYT